MNIIPDLLSVDTSMLSLQDKLAILSEKVLKEAEARKKAEKALEGSENMFSLLSHNLVDVIWQMDRKLKFTYVSTSIYNMTGYSAEEWVGTYLYQHASKKEFIKMARQALGALKNYKSFTYVIFDGSMLKKNGDVFPVEIVGRVMLNEKGLPTGVQGSTRDITKRKELETELASHIENLEELVQQRTFELEKQNSELERLNKLFVGREFRIKELRDELSALK